jgi:hypothetical protein
MTARNNSGATSPERVDEQLAELLRRATLLRS